MILRWSLLGLPLFMGILSLVEANNVTIDKNGYVVYCPCMGRFGNQMDQHLGAFLFARSLGRTLVLPPVVEYKPGSVIAEMVAFEDVFQLNPIKKSFKVVTMKEFQRDIMPIVWPEGQRAVFCWTPRKSSRLPEDSDPSCNAKDGNPFGPFWDYVGVREFDNNVYFGSVVDGFDVHRMENKNKWISSYTSSEYPVLAFTGAPSAFPSREESWKVQKDLRFASRIVNKAKRFIEETLERPFVGVHLRNNIDWARACEHVDPEKNLFASAQCLGDYLAYGKLSKEMCNPSTNTIVNAIVDQVGRLNARSVFVASDKDHLLEEINQALAPYEIRAYHLEGDDPLVSLSILELSDHFIGNCVSTFSHFVKRSRDHKWKQVKPSSFFAFKPVDRSLHRSDL